jgi:hypothetical protein
MKFDLWRGWSRCRGLLAIITVACGAFGCGGSGAELKTGVAGAAKKLSPEQMYHYEGTGKDRKKVMIDRRERVRLLREAGVKG